MKDSHQIIRLQQKKFKILIFTSILAERTETPLYHIENLFLIFLTLHPCVRLFFDKFSWYFKLFESVPTLSLFRYQLLKILGDQDGWMLYNGRIQETFACEHETRFVRNPFYD